MGEQSKFAGIRRATHEDAFEISLIGWMAWRINFTEFLPEEFVERIWDLRGREASIKRDLKAGKFILVAIGEEGKILGFASQTAPASLEGFDAEIGALYVHPLEARSGIGTSLVFAMIAHFREEGARNMAIHTLAQNAPGCQFYEKLRGCRHQETMWEGYPGVWFAWNNIQSMIPLK